MTRQEIRDLDITLGQMVPSEITDRELRVKLIHDKVVISRLARDIASDLSGYRKDIIGEKQDKVNALSIAQRSGDRRLARELEAEVGDVLREFNAATSEYLSEEVPVILPYRFSLPEIASIAADALKGSMEGIVSLEPLMMED
jgi:hypothetical protein